MDLLLIEDDPAIGRALNQGFSEAGHHCNWAQDGDRGLELARSQRFDAIVLDLMLPSVPGMSILRDIRQRGIQAPVVVLTARGAVEDRVAGLDSGADDYLVKPFDFVELMARVHAVCRRAQSRPQALMKVGNLQLDLTSRRVLLDDHEIELTPTEFSVLEMLMRYAGLVVTRRMLCEHLWESDWEGTTNVIEVHINRLRGKLAKGSKEPLIQTIRGRGYALRAQ